MSFLARLAMRAGIPGGGGAEPLLVPKDRGLQRSPRLARQEAPPEEDEEVQTLRRQLETEGEEEEVQTLRRQVAGANEGAAPPPMVAANSEELQADAPRTGDELPMVRRMAGEPEEEAQPIRRMVMKGQESPKVRPPLSSAVVQRSLRGESARALGSATAPAIVADQPEPPNPGAPAEGPPRAAPAWPLVLAPLADPTDPPSWGAAAPPQPLAEAAEPPRGHFERPQVVIDRLDVLIHEPAPPARGPDSAWRRSRSFRARYLRRL